MHAAGTDNWLRRLGVVVNLDEKIYAAPLVTSFAGHGALDVVVSTMEGHVHAFKAQGSRFHPTAFCRETTSARYDSFGVVLHERDYRVMRGSRVDVSYEIIDRRALDHAKASVTSHAPYVARFSLTTLDGFERTVSATHARCGKFTVRVDSIDARARRNSCRRRRCSRRRRRGRVLDVVSRRL